MVISLGITTNSKNKLEVFFKDYQKRFLQTVRRLLAFHGEAIKLKTKDEIKNGDKSGRWYTYKGRRYQASAEGEVAAYRSGALYKSIKSKRKDGGFTAEVSTNVSYAPYLLNNLNRKIFEPAFDTHKDMFLDNIRDLINKGLM